MEEEKRGVHGGSQWGIKEQFGAWKESGSGNQEARCYSETPPPPPLLVRLRFGGRMVFLIQAEVRGREEPALRGEGKFHMMDLDGVEAGWRENNGLCLLLPPPPPKHLLQIKRQVEGGSRTSSRRFSSISCFPSFRSAPFVGLASPSLSQTLTL